MLGFFDKRFGDIVYNKMNIDGHETFLIVYIYFGDIQRRALQTPPSHVNIKVYEQARLQTHRRRRIFSYF